jgi:hypothetical protein
MESLTSREKSPSVASEEAVIGPQCWCIAIGNHRPMALMEQTHSLGAYDDVS